MDKKFANSEEKYLKKVVLYAKDSSDGYLYTDSTTTMNINRVDLLNLCMKGLAIISYKGAFHAPVIFKDSGGTVTVTIATTLGASNTAILELKSKEAA